MTLNMSDLHHFGQYVVTKCTRLLIFTPDVGDDSDHRIYGPPLSHAVNGHFRETPPYLSCRQSPEPEQEEEVSL